MFKNRKEERDTLIKLHVNWLPLGKKLTRFFLTYLATTLLNVLIIKLLFIQCGGLINW